MVLIENLLYILCIIIMVIWNFNNVILVSTIIFKGGIC